MRLDFLFMKYKDILDLQKSERVMWRKVEQVTHVVKQRNKSLANLIELMYFLRYAPVLTNIKEYVPKRGKKSEIPLNLVMDELNVSHRTAQDYVRTVLILDKLFDLRISQKIGMENIE